MKKIFSIVFVLFVSFALLLSGCGKTEIENYNLTTNYPDDFKIVVRVNIGSIYSEHTFAVLNDVYYYKYQDYTENFASMDTLMVQYVGIKSGSEFISYNYDDTLGWYETDAFDFADVWDYLDTYCSAPPIIFTAEQKQPDSTVNGVDCYHFWLAEISYKISKDSYHIEWYFHDEDPLGHLSYEVQSFTTTNCFAQVPTNHLPTAA